MVKNLKTAQLSHDTWEKLMILKVKKKSSSINQIIEDYVFSNPEVQQILEA